MSDNIKTGGNERKLFSELDNQNIVWIVNKIERNQVLSQIGYEIKDNIIVDNVTKKPIASEVDKSRIDINKDDRFILVGNSHHFVRNVREYIEYLSDTGKLEVEEKD